MEAVLLPRYGTEEVLQFGEVPTPQPAPHEVLVHVHAASLNDWDWAVVQGKPFAARLLHGLLRPRVRIPGCDMAGRVEAVGSQVTTLQPGDEVYGDLCECGFGAFAEYVCVPAREVGRKPAGMSFEQAAAIPQAGMLAVQGMVDVGGLRAGQSVLLNGAGGGVGTFALQLAKLHDVDVTVVDKAGKLDMLRALGADHVVDYAREDFTRSGRRYDLILDVKTDRPLRAYAGALNPGGVYATVGGDTGRLLRVAWLGSRLAGGEGRRLRLVALKPNKDLAYVNELFEAGRLKPVLDRSYRLDEVREAFRHLATGDHQGKIVLSMN